MTLEHARSEPVGPPLGEVYRAAFHLAPFPLGLVDGAGPARILLVNDALLELLALPAGRVQGRPLDEVFRGAAAVQIADAVAQALEHSEPVRLRVAHAPNGRVGRLGVSVRPARIAGRRLVFLRLEPLRARIPLSELGDGGVLAELGPLSRGLVYILDLESGRLRTSSHPLAERLGLGAQLSRAKRMALIHPDDRAEAEAALGDLLAADHQVRKGVVRLRDVDGAWRWIEFRSRPFTRDAAGRVRKIIGVATDVTRSRAQTRALAEAAEALAHAEADERRRIGRELHDSTSQLLVAARLALASLDPRGELDARGRRALAEARAALAAAQDEIRNLAFALHTPALDGEGMTPALRAFASGFGRRTELSISVRAAKDRRPGPPEVEFALFRVAQEALMNVYRHAKARRVWIRLRKDDEAFTLEVEDDGIGLPTAGAGPPSGVGIAGMRARMTQLGGTLELTCGARGLLVRARVPARSEAG